VERRQSSTLRVSDRFTADPCVHVAGGARGRDSAAKAAGKKSWKGDERTIKAELLPRHRANWRYVKVRDLTRTMIRSMFKAITDRGAPVMANRTLALVSTMLNYALVELEWIEANPAARIRKHKETPRPRVLSDAEIRELWAATNETTRTNEQGQRVVRLNATLNDAFKMRFYTAQRGCEVFLMRWEVVDLETGWWRFPACSRRTARFIASLSSPRRSNC
jgi:integrase